MPERLNGIIKALESGKPAFTTSPSRTSVRSSRLATSNYDGVVFEMEHNPWDIRALRDGLQYMLNRAPDRQVRLDCARGHADRAHPAQRRWR